MNWIRTPRAPASPHRVAATCALALVALLVMQGCGNYAFVNRKIDADEVDPRENLILTDVDASLTSGPATTKRILGTDSTFEFKTGRLITRNVQVQSYTTTGAVEGITSAGAAIAYFRDSSEEGRVRNDLTFTSGVVHRAPQPPPAAGDRIELQSERLVYDSGPGLFRSPGTFQVKMAGVGKAPVKLTGNAFAATSNLKLWSVQGGTLGNQTTSQSAALRKSLEEATARIDAEAVPVPRRDPISVPVDSPTTASASP